MYNKHIINLVKYIKIMKKKFIISSLFSLVLFPSILVPLTSLTSCSDTSLFSPTQKTLIQGNSNQSIYMNVNDYYLEQEINFIEYTFKYFNAENNEEYSVTPKQIISADTSTGTIVLSDYSKELDNDIIVEVSGKAITSDVEYEHTTSVILKKDHPHFSFNDVHTTIYERIGNDEFLYHGIIKQTNDLRNFIIGVESNEFNNYSTAKINVSGKILNDDYKFISIYTIEQDVGYKIGLNVDPNAKGTHLLNPVKVDIQIFISLLGNTTSFITSIWVQALV